MATSDTMATYLDFSADPVRVRLFVEGERLTYGHLFNPTFATEVSLIDPLPHQRIAVYEHMLEQPRLRFLLADDAGAGKTIMTGLYIREMLARRLIRRILIVPPAGLVGNWEREMRTLFSLTFRLVGGSEAKDSNPFKGPESDLLIVKIDTLAGDRMFARLHDAEPYDLVVFDEAHKLSARRDPDGTFRATDRYRLAASISDVSIGQHSKRWSLPWTTRHLLLLTATPHMGKDFPYYCLWRLLEPEALSTHDALQAYPTDARRHHFIRRTKEEMVRLDGTPLYPMRISDTLSYELSQGEEGEQVLYDRTTSYIQTYYNKARILNRSAARLAMSVFQRRLASSTWALICSFGRRIQKIEDLIQDIRSGRMTPEQLLHIQRDLDIKAEDSLEITAADEGVEGEDTETTEEAAKNPLAAVIATSLAELEAERLLAVELLALARKVYEKGQESKFDKLREELRDERYREQKILIFTEHRDTLNYLCRRLEGLGFAGQIASIYGQLDYQDREKQVDFFRKPLAEGGARFLVATDAAGEGINLQFCWLMVNYDIPWNPARLEQRMGRIHRYGQKHDPVVIINLVAGKTREGRVLRVLLEKLEIIRKELRSDKVFDVIGRIFEGVSIRDYMEKLLGGEDPDSVGRDLQGMLTPEQVNAIQERERRLYGDGGDVKRDLGRLRDGIDREIFRQLLPGYVRRYLQHGAPILHIGLEGNLDATVSFRADAAGALDALWPLIEKYPDSCRNRFTLIPRSPTPGEDHESTAVFLRPGEPVFDRLRALLQSSLSPEALRGALFVDPTEKEPYLFHLALISVERAADSTLLPLAHSEPLECRLVALKQTADGGLREVAIEHLLLLTGAAGFTGVAIPFVANSLAFKDRCATFLRDKLAQSLADVRRAQKIAALEERESFLKRGFSYEEAELADRRAKLTQRIHQGQAFVQPELDEVKARQQSLFSRREQALAVLHREPELIRPGEIKFVVHALVVPSSSPEERDRYDAEVEAMAVKVARGHEEEFGARIKDISKPDLARAAGLGDHPGFDLLSDRRDGERRCIEVKGRAAVGDIQVSENEWAKACNLREKYWLYVVYDCASPHPRLIEIQDPFAKLLVKAKVGVVIGESEILSCTGGAY